jgi:hypothetical protein
LTGPHVSRYTTGPLVERSIVYHVLRSASRENDVNLQTGTINYSYKKNVLVRQRLDKSSTPKYCCDGDALLPEGNCSWSVARFDEFYPFTRDRFESAKLLHLDKKIDCKDEKKPFSVDYFFYKKFKEFCLRFAKA